jgi:two-component system chemotaxis response regulator CheY
MTNPIKIDERWRVLIVDDHHLTREMVRAILGGMGFSNFALAENGLVAYKILQDSLKIDLIVCDWNMPHASGLELLKKVRSDTRLKGIPFVMLTAEAYRDNVEAAVAAGVSGYVIKPFTAAVLSDKIYELMASVRPRL